MYGPGFLIAFLRKRICVVFSWVGRGVVSPLRELLEGITFLYWLCQFWVIFACLCYG